MNDFAIGRALRVLRHRMRLRQADVAERAGISQQLVSKIELGRSASISVRALRKVFAAVDADAITFVRWRAGELDRLLDEGHASLVGRIVSLLESSGWQVLAEVTYAEYGERGSIDVLAWHPRTRTLLVIEVKTEITSAEELLRRHDAKVRLAPGIGRDRFGVTPARTARLLVVGDTRTNRRRVDALSPVLGPGYPARGAVVRRWLRDPTGEVGGVLFMPVDPGRGGRGSRSRVSRARPAA